MGLKRGDVVTVALQGDLGKPRPAVIVETDLLAPTSHVLICPGTGTVREEAEPRRVLVAPDSLNGLRVPTQFQIDKLIAARRDRCGDVIGHLDQESLNAIASHLVVLLGLAE